MSQYKKLLDHKNWVGQTQKMSMGQKTGWANKLGEPNTKLGGPVPDRPTRSAATACSCLLHGRLCFKM